MWGVFVDIDGLKHGQKSRSVVRNKIQTNSNFKAHVYNYIFAYSNKLLVWYCSQLSCSVISIASYTNIFRTLRHHQAQIQDHVQQQSSQTTVLNMARYRKEVSRLLCTKSYSVACAHLGKNLFFTCSRYRCNNNNFNTF